MSAVRQAPPPALTQTAAARPGLRAALRRVPRAAWACAAVAMLNAVVWAMLTPPFHVPDEPQHVAYAQYFAETGKLPRPVQGTVFSNEEAAAADAVGMNSVIGNRGGRPPWTEAQEDGLRASLARPLSRVSQGGNSNVTNNPPLYYFAEAIPYKLASSGDFFARLFWMRLLSALLAGVTVLFVFLFLRELLPAAPWAWTVGALAVAFQPTFGFISGGVNNDSLFFTAAAATFFLLARAFRRGLTPRLGLALGVAVAVGVLGKATMVGLLPGVALGLAALAWRAGPERRGAALRGAAVAVAAVAVPVAAYMLANRLAWDRPLWSGAGTASTTGSGHPSSTSGLLSYAWQFYLPRLPFMSAFKPTGYPVWEVWFKGFIGRFGWLDYGFRQWVYWLALGIWVPMLALAGAALYRARAVLRARWPEAATYAGMTVGLLVLIVIAGYRGRIDSQTVFEQARYLLPLLCLYAGVVALAARGAGRRLAPAAGGVLVGLAMGHGLFAMLLTVSRFYG